MSFKPGTSGLVNSGVVSMSASSSATQPAKQPSKRLPSLFGQKDLSLATSSSSPNLLSSSAQSANVNGSSSGVQPQVRRQFMPNLAAAGKRIISTDSSASASGTKPTTAVRNSHQVRGGFARGNNRLLHSRTESSIIQSKGIFSDGPIGPPEGEREGRGGIFGSRFCGPNLRSSTAEGVSPARSQSASPVKKAEAFESDEVALRTLLRDAFIVDDDDDDSGDEDSKEALNLLPVRLPMPNAVGNSSSERQQSKCPPEAVKRKRVFKRLKVEVDDEDDNSQSMVTDTATESTPRGAEEISLANCDAQVLFQCSSHSHVTSAEGSSVPPLVLMQLPSAFYDMAQAATASASGAKSSVIMKAEVKTEDVTGLPSTSTAVSDTQQQKQASALNANLAEKPHCLSSFPEGAIGKLQVLKSGRVRMLIGSHRFFVELGTPSAFVQELVSINPQYSSDVTSEGDMVVLGETSHKLVVRPDAETTLRKRKKQT